jgi:hypothetical protein
MNSIATIIRQLLEPARLPVPVPVPVPRTRMPRVIAALAAVAIASSVASASAAPRSVASRDEVDGQLVDVQVLVDGWTTPLYMRPGAWDKTYFQAFKGKNYSLVVRNTTNQRVGVLLAVDGLNVVNGQKSNLSNREAMYVLDPWESATIQGWRTSLRDVRRFVFVDEERSYASRTDQANGDMGWIRVLSFREQNPVVWRDVRPRVKDGSEWQGRNEMEGQRGETREAPPSASGDLRAQKSPSQLHTAPQSDAAPGTGWGEQSWDPVRRTQFTAVARATDHLVLRYEYASGLRALGIFPRERRVFERERGEMGFAAPPRW